MTIEQTDVIDAIGIDNITGELILSVIDPLPWNEGDDLEHIYLLQEKINTYLRFIESGEIFETYPQGNGRSTVISIISQYSLSQSAQDFLNKIFNILEPLQIKLSF